MKLSPPNFTFKTTALGDLKCIPLTLGMELEEIPRQLGKKIEDTTPDHFVRVLMTVTCRKVKLKNNILYEPKDSAVSLEDVNTLKDTDLENFSKRFIEANDHLYRKSISRSEKNSDGTNTIHLEKGDTEYPRLDEESFINYLHRLFIIKLENDKKHALQMLKGMSDWPKTMSEFQKSFRNLNIGKGFSPSVQAQIFRTSEADLELRATIDQAKAMSTVDKMKQSFAGFNEIANYLKTPSYLEDISKIIAKPTSIEEISTPAITANLAESIQKQREAQSKPLLDIAERLDTLISVADKGENMLREMNESQNAISIELKQSGQKSYKLNRWVLIVAIASLAVPLVLGLHSIFMRQQSEYGTSQNVKNITLDESTSLLLKQLITQQQLIIKEFDSIKKNLAQRVPKEGNNNLGSKHPLPSKTK